jgi:2-keto-4-pentenoate hydratase/2-oxohepta-3-ene-1,7-dioic acid hydratase in catechol pathway
LKLVTFSKEGKQSIGAVKGNSIVDLSTIAPDMLSFIDRGDAALKQARQLLESATTTIPLDSVKLHAPIPLPRRNIMCLGHNYAEHARESDEARGIEHISSQPPTVFTKATHTVNGPYDNIPYDAAVSTEIDWEAELGVVLGRSGKNISVEQALEHVFGYFALNDVSARDLQFHQPHNSQFFRGKSLDGACPMGPWIVTADEIPDPHALRLVCRVNGSVKQDGYTSQMIYRIPVIISALSHGMTLDAGDLIATGTPMGVGFSRKPPEYLKPGDVVEVEVEQVGLIRNRVSS